MTCGRAGARQRYMAKAVICNVCGRLLPKTNQRVRAFWVNYSYHTGTHKKGLPENRYEVICRSCSLWAGGFAAAMDWRLAMQEDPSEKFRVIASMFEEDYITKYMRGLGK